MEIFIVEVGAESQRYAHVCTESGGRVAGNGHQARGSPDRQPSQVVVLDLNPAGIPAPELLERLRSVPSETRVLILTAPGTTETIVNALRLGAFGPSSHPLPLTDLEPLCRTAYDGGRMPQESRRLTSIEQAAVLQTPIVGRSESMRDVFQAVERVGASDKRVLILGESGTGKELIARALVEASPRAGRPLVTVNCGAIPDQLVENEFFGHDKGAFTGATAATQGLFEVADGGTLFIDEIAELPLALQPKLLRVLEDGWMRRVGSHRERRVDVRIIAATNRDLATEVKAGRFREDLYFRINVVSIKLPPLRDRSGDIPLLVDYFLGPGWEIEPEARRALERYDWPGNVRELRNALERATVLATNTTVTLDDLPPEVQQHERAFAAGASGASAGMAEGRLDAVERVHILRVLEQYHGNKARAARALGIHRRTLYRLLDRYRTGSASVTAWPLATPGGLTQGFPA
jgi:DNA-binding NtrC family response regulator